MCELTFYQVFMNAQRRRRWWFKSTVLHSRYTNDAKWNNSSEIPIDHSHSDCKNKELVFILTYSSWHFNTKLFLHSEAFKEVTDIYYFIEHKIVAKKIYIFCRTLHAVVFLLYLNVHLPSLILSHSLCFAHSHTHTLFH
jgi:hypothetical protein